MLDNDKSNKINNLVIEDKIINKDEKNKTHFKLLENTKTYIVKVYKLLIATPIGKSIVLILFALYLSFSIWKIINIEKSIDLSQVVSSKSYLKKYLNDFVSNDLSPPLMIVMHTPVDFGNVTVKKRIEDLLLEMQSLDGVENDFYLLNNFLFDGLNASKEISIDQYKNLYTSYPFFNDFAFDYNNKTNKYEITASRLYLQIKKTFFNSRDTDLMDQIYDVAARYSDLSTTAFSMAFRNIDMFNQLAVDLMQLFLFLIEASYLFSLIFILNIKSAFCVMLSVISTYSGFCGIISAWNAPLNNITIVNYIIGLALSTTSCSYIIHLFLIEFDKESKNERVYNVIANTGISIVKAHLILAFSGLLLSFSHSVTFYLLFKTIFVINLISIFHVLLFIPVLLSIIGPHWKIHQKEIITNVAPTPVTLL